MVHLGVSCVGAGWSVLIVVFCSVLVPSPTHAYIYAVSDQGTHRLWWALAKSMVCLEIMSVLMYILFWQHYSNMTSMLFEDLPALFGATLPKDGLMVRAEYWRKGAYRRHRSQSYIMTFFCPLCEREFWWCPVHLMAVQQWILLLRCHHLMKPTPPSSSLSSDAMNAILI